MFEFLKKKNEFNLNDYLIKIGFNDVVKHSKYTSYSNGKYNINIFTKESGGYNTMSIELEDFNLSTMRFLPNSEILVDMILRRIEEEIYRNESSE